MEMQYDQMIDRITQFMKGEARTETVIGEAFQLGEFSCIPVIRVGMGFGTGGGEGESEKDGHGGGSAAGAGMGIEPIGFLVSRGPEISFVSTRSNSAIGKAFEKVPDLFARYLESQKDKKQQALQ